MMFNPNNAFAMAGMPQKNPKQMQDEINTLMQQYNSMYNNMNNIGNNMPNNNMQENNQKAVSEKGEFVKISKYDEVEDYPTRLDGTATLLFDFKNKVFWSKKYVNGCHSIQTFKFEPLNNVDISKVEDEEEVDYTKVLDDIPEIADKNEERFKKIEQTLTALLEKLEDKVIVEAKRIKEEEKVIEIPKTTTTNKK